MGMINPSTCKNGFYQIDNPSIFILYHTHQEPMELLWEQQKKLIVRNVKVE